MNIWTQISVSLFVPFTTCPWDKKPLSDGEVSQCLRRGASESTVNYLQEDTLSS